MKVFLIILNLIVDIIRNAYIIERNRAAMVLLDTR